MYADEKPIGLFKGFSPVPRELDVEIVVPHGAVELPMFGEFILVEMEPNKAAVGRVIHYHPTGPLASRQGEGYLAEMGKGGKEFPESIRDLVLRYSMKVALLGILKKDETGFNFLAGVRSLAKLGMHVRKPSLQALRFLTNVNLDISNKSTVEFGNYALATDERKEVKVHFSIDGLKSKRTFVFARAGYGKSNLIKYLISKMYVSPPEVGLLIFDPEGEYALPQQRKDKPPIPGLASLPDLRERIRYFSLRPPLKGFEGVQEGSVKVNFADFSPRAILNAFVPPEKHINVWASWIKSMKIENWSTLVKLLKDDGYRVPDGELAKLVNVSVKKDNVSIQAIKNNLITPIWNMHDPKSTLAANLIDYLREKKIVIVDISMLSNEDGLAITGLLMQKVFTNNVKAITDPSNSKNASTVVVLEEAQAILGSKNLSEQSIFVRWVKEGRKYGLGAILVTQQPGSIAHEILSQGDNFFVMHMLNQNDLDVLKRVNAHYAPDILDQIRNEPIKGNCFFWSAPDQPYVISVKVKNFDEVAQISKTYEEKHDGDSKPRKITLSAGGRACLEVINKDHDLFVYKIKEKKAYAVSYKYLGIHIKREIKDFNIESLPEILNELGWKYCYEAKLTEVGGNVTVVVLLAKFWAPQDGKEPKGEVVVRKIVN